LIKAITIAAVLAGAAVFAGVHPVVRVLTSHGESPSIYWGAYVEGTETYGALYGGNWSNAPWCDPGTQCPLPRFEQDAGKSPSIVHWGMCWTCDFDPRVAAKVARGGAIPAVDWSTIGVSDADVANGRYDSWLTSQATAMRDFGRPMFLLFDEEMNGTWYSYSPGADGNTPADFVAMWRHVHDIFASVGASNVTWVWCPNVVQSLSDGTSTPTPLAQLYPGDAYVDWTGLNGYNWGGSSWESFSTVFRPSYEALLRLAPTKPIMIGEVASAEEGGSKAAWISDALTSALPQDFPQVKALLWFNWNVLEKGTRWPWEIESSTASQQAFATGIRSPYYAPSGSFGSLTSLSKVQPLP
jgi:hypothetical protein